MIPVKELFHLPNRLPPQLENHWIRGSQDFLSKLLENKFQTEGSDEAPVVEPARSHG